MAYAVLYRTATHVAFTLHDSEQDARNDAHLDDQWRGRLYEVADADGFGSAEAKELWASGPDAMPAAWGIERIA